MSFESTGQGAEQLNSAPDLLGENANIENEGNEKSRISFRPYQKGWLDLADSPFVADEACQEYRENSAISRLLSEVSDAAVVGYYLEKSFLDFYGSEFYDLRPYDAEPISLGRSYEDYKSAEGPLFLDMLGYHPHGKVAFARAFEGVLGARSRLDVADFYRPHSLRATKEMIARETEFSPESFFDIQHFATTLAVTVEDEAFEQEFGKAVRGALHVPTGVIFISEFSVFMQHSLRDLLIHEFTHLVDLRILKDYKGEGTGDSAKKEDRTISLLVKEFAAYLSSFDARATSLTRGIEIAEKMLTQGSVYGAIAGDPEFEKNTCRFAAALRDAIPYVIGLMQEAGLNTRNVEVVDFLKTFIRSLPERTATLRLLEAVQETDVYHSGLQALRKE